MTARFVLPALLLAACAAPQRPHPRVTSAFRFDCTPADAHLLVDEVDQGQCRLWQTQYLGLAAGTHRLIVHREGFLDMEQELPETHGRQTVHLQLRPLPE